MADEALVNVVPPVKDPNPNSGGGGFGPTPVMSDYLTFKTMGSSGLRAFGGYVREEFLPQLQGRNAQTVYREMSDNSPIIGGMLFAINAAMRKVEWRVNPASDTPEAIEKQEFVEGLMEDMGETWEDTIAESLSMLPFGYAPQELVYKRRRGPKPGMRLGKPLPGSKFDDGLIGWADLPLRGQDTIYKWFFDENGKWTGMSQMPWVGPLVDIPAEKLLLFRPSSHKGNPEGRSILRNAYRPYYFIKRLEEQEAILHERLNGIPVIRLPGEVVDRANAGDANAAAIVQSMKNIVINLRIDEQMGLILPSDVYQSNNGPTSVQTYGFELVSPGGGTGSVAADPVIQRHTNQMMMSTLADFLTLGHSKVGTQALSNSKEDMFFQAVEGYLNSNAAVLNRQGLARLWDLNGFDPELMPEIAPDMAQRMDLDVLGNFVQRMAQSGMPLFPNTDLQSALMDAAGLPDIADSSAGELLAEGDMQDVPPMATAGPLAAAALSQLQPERPKPGEEPGEEGGPPKNSPRDKIEKMIKASYLRRAAALTGGGPGTKSTKRARKRGTMPTR